jgi:hypothetical protein
VFAVLALVLTEKNVPKSISGPGSAGGLPKLRHSDRQLSQVTVNLLEIRSRKADNGLQVAAALIKHYEDLEPVVPRSLIDPSQTGVDHPSSLIPAALATELIDEGIVASNTATGKPYFNLAQ